MAVHSAAVEAPLGTTGGAITTGMYPAVCTRLNQPTDHGAPPSVAGHHCDRASRHV
jgi:hypothetical protein